MPVLLVSTATHGRHGGSVQSQAIADKRSLVQLVAAPEKVHDIGLIV